VSGNFTLPSKWGCNKLGSFGEGSKNLTTQTSTPRFVEEGATEVMQVDKIVELF
jgi:hypothetical protein